jgi:hypothetical protein
VAMPRHANIRADGPASCRAAGRTQDLGPGRDVGARPALPPRYQHGQRPRWWLIALPGSGGHVVVVDGQLVDAEGSPERRIGNRNAPPHCPGCSQNAVDPSINPMIWRQSAAARCQLARRAVTVVICIPRSAEIGRCVLADRLEGQTPIGRKLLPCWMIRSEPPLRTISTIVNSSVGRADYQRQTKQPVILNTDFTWLSP